MCVLVERRFRILQITKIYAESVCVNKRALERAWVRRNCDDVSSEKFLLFGFSFFSFLFSQKSQQHNTTNATKIEKVTGQSLRGRFWDKNAKRRETLREKEKKKVVTEETQKRIKTESMLKKVDVSTRIAPVLSSF